MLDNKNFSNIDGIVMPLVFLISIVVLVVTLTLVIIEKSNKVKKEFNNDKLIVSNCKIDHNKSVDGSIILDCKFAN